MGTSRFGFSTVFFLPKKNKIIKMKLIVAVVLFCAVASTQALNWKSCGGSALNIKTLTVKQDPIVFPGPIDATLVAETTQDMVAPIKVEMSLKKNGLTLPCIPLGDKMLGSCTYDDICKTLEKIPDDCKNAGILGNLIAEAGLPCRCLLSLPSWLRVWSRSPPRLPTALATSSDVLSLMSTPTFSCRQTMLLDGVTPLPVSN